MKPWNNFSFSRSLIRIVVAFYIFFFFCRSLPPRNVHQTACMRNQERTTKNVSHNAGSLLLLLLVKMTTVIQTLCSIERHTVAQARQHYLIQVVDLYVPRERRQKRVMPTNDWTQRNGWRERMKSGNILNALILLRLYPTGPIFVRVLACNRITAVTVRVQQNPKHFVIAIATAPAVSLTLNTHLIHEIDGKKKKKMRRILIKSHTLKDYNIVHITASSYPIYLDLYK